MNKAKTKGFSLIEVIVAMVILSIGFVAVTTSLATFIRSMTMDEKTLEAINLVNFYQAQVYQMDTMACSQPLTPFVAFICQKDETLFKVELSQNALHDWAHGRLLVKKVSHKGGYLLDYELFDKNQLLLRSQQWQRL